MAVTSHTRHFCNIEFELTKSRGCHHTPVGVIHLLEIDTVQIKRAHYHRQAEFD